VLFVDSMASPYVVVKRHARENKMELPPANLAQGQAETRHARAAIGTAQSDRYDMLHVPFPPSDASKDRFRRFEGDR